MSDFKKVAHTTECYRCGKSTNGVTFISSMYTPYCQKCYEARLITDAEYDRRQAEMKALYERGEGA